MVCFWLGFFNICNIALFIMHGAYDKWTWAYSHKPVFDFLIVSNKSALCLLQARLAHPTSWVCCHEIYFPCSISYIICQLSWAHNFKYWLLARNARLLILMNQQMTVPHPFVCHDNVTPWCTPAAPDIVLTSTRGPPIAPRGALNVITMSTRTDACLEWYNRNELTLYSIYLITCIYVCKSSGFSMLVCVWCRIWHMYLGNIYRGSSLYHCWQALHRSLPIHQSDVYVFLLCVQSKLLILTTNISIWKIPL